MNRLRPRAILSLLALAPLPASADGTPAASANDFLDSIGVCVHIQHNQPAAKFVELLKFTGVRNVRDGADGNYDLTGLLLLHREAGVHVVFGPGSGPGDDAIAKTITAARELAQAGALLAIEGPNEPNNFGGVTYHGENSTKLRSWLPVAHFQQELYAAVKSDPLLKTYPVFGVSEAGAEDDNSGLQFLTIPHDAHTLMPDGTLFADFANCHNYVCGHTHALWDNQATLAASVRPRKAAIDHLYGNHGLTWRKKFPGYSEAELSTLPKVTTETGWKTNNTPEGDAIQGTMLMAVYLAQFKAGWKHTFVYEFTDDPDGAFGFYHGDYTTPRLAATWLHNLTTVLADTPASSPPSTVNYSIPDQPATVHDLLLQKADGTCELIVWGEQVAGVNSVKVHFSSACSVKVYDPTIKSMPISTLDHADSVPLSVSDHAMVIEFRP